MIAFDALNQKYLTSSKTKDGTQGQHSLLFQSYDDQGTLLEKTDVTDIVCPKTGSTADTSSSAGTRGDGLRPEVESKMQNPPNSWSFEDNMSILRFKHSPKTAVRVSNCGFEVTVVKGNPKKSEYHLVFTNMAFNIGVHFWEVICPISC